jgi:PTS system nitrogen regulatory IIA component
MVLENLIKSDSVLCNAQARSKKHCLEILSEVLAQNTPDIANEEIFSKLIERERLGCTSLDSGVAFPHCRIADLTSPTGALLKLSEPVDFDAPDAQPVDLVFGMMVPAEFDAEVHTDIGQISSFLKDDDLRARLRSATSSKELYDALISGQEKPGESAT